MTPESLRLRHRIYRLSRSMNYKIFSEGVSKAWLCLALLVALMIIPSALAQQPSVDAVVVRGGFAGDSRSWNAENFAWFYYDLDKGIAGEELSVQLDGNRSIDKGHVVYTSRTWSSQFEYKPWGNYYSIAFLGKRYLAGYPESSFSTDISSLGKGELRPILIDDKEIHGLTYNASLPLLDGYSLALAELADDSGAAHLLLMKDGTLVDQKVAEINSTCAFKQGDLPILLVHVSNALSSGPKQGVAEVNGLFQVSDTPDVRLNQSMKLDNMEISDLSDSSLQLRSDKGLALSRNSLVPLVDGLYLTVVDDPNLIYYPVGIISDYGDQEIRGAVFTGSTAVPVLWGFSTPTTAVARWNINNFSGFYFDPEKKLGAESLILFRVNGRTIQPTYPPRLVNGALVADGMYYSTIVQPKQFEYSPWGYYNVVSLFGQPWFAGYSNNTSSDISNINLMDYQRLSQVLINSNQESIAISGTVFQLANGYQFVVRKVGNDSLFAQLLNGGQVLDNMVLKSNSTYLYKKKVGDINDLPVIAIHIKNIFNDGKNGLAAVDGIFQISDLALPVEVSMGFGNMKIVASTPYFIVFINTDNLYLNPDDTVNILPGIDIRVADNDTLRYYLYTTQYVVPRPRLQGFDYQKNVSLVGGANFTMEVKAANIVSVTAEIRDGATRTVFARDLTSLGQGYGDTWRYIWHWNATAFVSSDDGSLVMDTDGTPVPSILYLNASAKPIIVGTKFDEHGRIASISDKNIIYYISPSEYAQANLPVSYESMILNSTLRSQYLKIQPGVSLLKFISMISDNSVLDRSNHTLKGSIASLEPHLITRDALPGQHEVALRIENSVDALRVGGIYFNLTWPKFNGVAVGSGQIRAGENASIPMLVTSPIAERVINITYDPSVVSAKGTSGQCSAPSYIDQKKGSISIIMPANCTMTNITFDAKKANATTDLRVMNVEGLKPDRIINGSIAVLPGNSTGMGAAQSKKSSAPGYIIGLAVLALAAFLRRKK